MVMVINRRIPRVLFENRTQYIGSVILIIFGSFLFTLLGQFAMNFERMTIAFQNGYKQEEASFTTESKLENLQELESAAGVTIEEGLSFDYTIAEGKKLRIFSRNQRINLPAVIAGKDLGRSGDILINPASATANNYKIGDTLKIEDKPFVITGLVALPNYIYPLQSETDMMPPPGFGIAVISREDCAILGKGSRSYAIRFKQDGQNLRTKVAQFRELLKSRGINVTQWTDIEDNKRVNIVATEIDVLNRMSIALPAAMLLLVIILIGNVIRRLIERESAVIGALYASGYRKREIYSHYLLFPLLIAFTGSITGTLTGLLPIEYMAKFFTSFFNIPLIRIGISPARMVAGLLLPVLFLGCSSWFAIRKELKHSPAELMRGKAEKNKVNFLERAFRMQKLKFPMKFRIREQLRSLSRLIFLLSGIAVATMLLLWGFALKSGFDYMLTGGLTRTYHFVYEYKFNGLSTDPLPPGAEPISAAFFLPADDDKRDFYITGVMPNSTMLKLYDASGTELSTDQVIITKPLAARMKLKKGDTATIIRKADNRRFSLRIDSIADTYAGNFIFMPLAAYNRKFEMPEGSYTGAFSNTLLNFPVNREYSVISLDEKVAGIREAIAPTLSMIGFLVVVAFIIGMIVIYIVTSLIVEENRNNISLMKIFGYRKREINSLILNSSTIIVIIGFITGIPLILTALGALMQSMENSIGLTLPPLRIDLPYILIGFIVVMSSYELSKFLCRKKINAVSMSEAIKSGMD